MHTTGDGSEEVRRLLVEQVPELRSGVVEIKAIARERGHRTMLAVVSTDSSVDPVSACVGERGARIKAVVRQLSGDHIEVIRWSESVEDLIRNVLAPVLVQSISLDAAAHGATVKLDSKHRNVAALEPVRIRLAAKVLGWDLRVVEA